MSELYQLLKQDGVTVLCEVMNVVYGYERNKIVQRLYGGGYMFQTVGEKSKRFKLTIRVWSQAEMKAVNEAEADAQPLILNYKGERYIGIIEDAPNWTAKVRGEVYTASVIFAVLEETA